jgi:outer membrane protein assembly factor BamD
MNKFLLFTILFTVLISCIKKEEFKESMIKENSLDLQVLEAYQEGMKNLESGDVLYAANKFNEAEILFPQSEWAPKSAIMAAYSYYTQDYYGDTIAELERFLKVYQVFLIMNKL